MTDNRPFFPYDVIIRDSANQKIIAAKVINAANAGEAKQKAVKYFGIELTRNLYKIQATRLQSK